MELDLSVLRGIIDTADDKLLDAFFTRMKTAGKIADYKKEKGLPVTDPAREEQLLARLREKMPQYAKETEALYKEILSLSKEKQKKDLAEKEKDLCIGLLGAKLSHSYSPLIHGELASYEYKLIEMEEKDLADFFRKKEFDGLNVTIPHKKAVIPFLDELSPTAKRLEAVNTIVNKNGKLYGYNTDYEGFCGAIDCSGIDFTGKKVLILGSGGASRAVFAAASDKGAGEILFISRTGENNYENLAKHADADIIVNATPVGMYPKSGASPLDLKQFTRLCAIFDLIYNPARTRLMQQAEELGIPAFGGIFMLAAQAKRSAELFLGRDLEVNPSEVAKKCEKKTRNLVLIGMPGCGKSTLGKLLARRLGLSFADCDELFLQKYDRSPAEVIKAQGEERFRQMETALLCEISSLHGYVIATGGGAVTRPENKVLLKENGFLLYLHKEPALLAVNGRPLSLARTPEALYRERLPLYLSFADRTVMLDRDTDKNLNLLTEAVQ